MIHARFEDLERRLTAAGREIQYPPTPNIARAVLQRTVAYPKSATREQPKGHPLPSRKPARLAYALAILLALTAGLLAVPSVRARILEFIQIGVVRIFIQGSETAGPSPTFPPITSTPAPAFLPTGDGRQFPTEGSPTVTAGSSLTPKPSPTPRAFLSELDGLTSLENATALADFPIRLPAYPPDLGLPDRVYYQEIGGQMLVLVWTDPADPNKALLSLHEFYGEDSLILEKGPVRLIQETSVEGQPAVWVQGPYFLKMRNGDLDLVRLIVGRVLIWEKDSVTYRLETDLSLDEAVRIAESLR